MNDTVETPSQEHAEDYYDETDINSSVVGEDEEYVATPPPSKSQKSTSTSASGNKKKRKTISPMLSYH